MQKQDNEPPLPSRHRGSQILFLLLGLSCVALAALGVALPLLPTTPFLLLAAACFARSSTRCHQWLLNHNFFGALIADWQNKGCINVAIKRIAIGSILLFGTLSMWLVASNWVRSIGVILLLIGLAVVLHLPTCTENTDSTETQK